MSSTTAISAIIAINMYGNSNSNNNHAKNASHEGENNDVNPNTVQSASPIARVPRSETYSSSTRTTAMLSSSTPLFGLFGAPWRILMDWAGTTTEYVEEGP